MKMLNICAGVRKKDINPNWGNENDSVLFARHPEGLIDEGQIDVYLYTLEGRSTHSLDPEARILKGGHFLSTIGTKEQKIPLIYKGNDKEELRKICTEWLADYYARQNQGNLK